MAELPPTVETASSHDVPLDSKDGGVSSTAAVQPKRKGIDFVWYLFKKCDRTECKCAICIISASADCTLPL